MNKRPYRDILDTAAADSLSRSANLWPKIEANLERKSLMLMLRSRPLVAMLIALFILLTLSGVVYALGRALGYIPGVGIVDQSVPLRVLAEPVSQTRDGLTITVKEVVLGADKTTFVLSMEMDGQSWGPCLAFQELRLPDGQVYQVEPGSDDRADTDGLRLSFAALPVDVTEATLYVLPCLQPTPGITPETWEFHLRFMPAPPDLTVLPVVEITPSPAPTATDAPMENPISITNVIDTGDGYILIGEFLPPAPALGGDWSALPGLITLTDADGREIAYELPQDIELSTPNTPHAEAWAIQFGREFVPPLHIAYSSQYLLPAPAQQPVEFEFDAGPNPSLDQVFEQEIELVGHLVQVTIYVSTHGYFFDFTCPDGVIQRAGVELPGYTLAGGGGGGEDGGYGTVPSGWSLGLDYSTMPTGVVKVVLSDIWIYGETQEWTLDWQP
jgi:hypothetical protein